MFTSLEFWLFTIIVLLLYYMTRGRLQNAVLLFASYTIYALLDWRFLGLLWLATALTYFLARRLTTKTNHRRRWLTLGVLLNLGILGVFKYGSFFATSVLALLSQ